mmetsp:Transcript_10880/g.47106  ORF Transcript_10880/g.47106 Transcript_10880/m.47106 type:complete len:309 (-) Transcript_10880:1067-1993(-)
MSSATQRCEPSPSNEGAHATTRASAALTAIRHPPPTVDPSSSSSSSSEDEPSPPRRRRRPDLSSRARSSARPNAAVRSNKPASIQISAGARAALKNLGSDPPPRPGDLYANVAAPTPSPSWHACVGARESNGARWSSPRRDGSNGSWTPFGSRPRALAATVGRRRYSLAPNPSTRNPKDTPSEPEDTVASMPIASMHACSVVGNDSRSSASSYTAVAVTPGQAIVNVSSVETSSSSSSLSRPSRSVARRSRYWDMCTRIPCLTCSIPSSSLESASSQMSVKNEDSGLTNSLSSSTSLATGSSSSTPSG